MLTQRLLQRLFVLVLFWSGASFASNIVVDRSWVEDPSGTMTIDQVRAAAAQPLTGPYFGRGFSTSTFWIRLRIDPSRLPAGSASDRLVVRIRPVYLHEIQLYDLLDDGDKPRMTGGHYSWRQDEYQSLNLNFVVPRGEAERDIWLRLRSFSSTFSSFEVLPESEARAIDLRQMLLAGLYQVLLFICLGWSALAWFMFRDSLIKFYLVREVVVIVYAMVIWGVWRSWGSTWAPVWWIERVSHFIMFLLGFTMVSFDAYFLRQFKPAPWLLKTLYGVSASFGFQLLVSMAGYWQEAFIINSYVLLLAIVLVFMTVLSTRAWSEPNPGQRPDFSKWLLVCMYVFLFLIVLFGRLAALGILSSGYDAFYLGMLYPLAGSVLMMALLQIRAMRRHKRQQEVQLRLHVVEQLAQDERIRREDQAHFLAMLGHELRNPLAAVGFLADSQTDEGKLIRRAVDDMTQVLERSMHVSKLGDARMAFEFTELNLHELT